MIAALASAACACSGNKSGSTETAETIDLSSFTGSNAMASAGTIDSLALEADFLTPEQGVAVLAGLSEIVRAEEAEGNRSKKLEYMRKYIDTYDILVNRSEDFTSEFDRLKSAAHIDFAALFAQYRDILSSEADGTSVEGDSYGITESRPAAAEADSTAASPSEDTPEAPADSIR